MFFIKRKKIQEYIDEAKHDRSIVVIDVRSRQEYYDGHIPNSKNIPLETIEKIDLCKDKPLYVYCYSGSRSSMAVRKLKQMGYSKVLNIGGINKWKKGLQKGE